MIPSGSSERDEFVARAEGHHQGPRRRNPKAALSRRRQVPGRSSPRSGRAVSGRKRSPRVATAKRRKNPAELKVGDRVRYSHHKIESFRRSHSGFNYMKGDRRRATADELMQELLDERGVVLEVHPPHGNVLAYGYKVLWEPSARYPQGITSSSIDSILTREDDPLLKGTGRRRNPRGSNVAAAAKTVRMFQDRGPIPVKAKRMKAPTPLKDTAAELGKLVGVVYRSDKFDGKTRDYEHDFSKPLPSLVTDPEGRGLHVVGGRYKVTPDGIVN
jgi:hypothetical protein